VTCGRPLNNCIAMTRTKRPRYAPCRITAFAETAHLVREVADAQGVEYDETPVPGKDHKLVSAMPKEVFVKRAIGGLDHLDVKTAKEVMLRIATLKGSEFNAENVKKIIDEVEARAKMH
jgi:phosphoglycerate dehydrogenase-like enzyme